MHELSLVMEVVRRVDTIAKSNNVSEVDTIVLQIGEIATVVPHFVQACYPAAVDGTWMADTKLKIEMVKASVRCNNCNKVFDPIEYHGVCPSCSCDEHEILTGREFVIKEIVCY